jgi:hypothetical protein
MASGKGEGPPGHLGPGPSGGGAPAPISFGTSAARCLVATVS